MPKRPVLQELKPGGLKDDQGTKPKGENKGHNKQNKDKVGTSRTAGFLYLQFRKELCILKAQRKGRDTKQVLQATNADANQAEIPKNCHRNACPAC